MNTETEIRKLVDQGYTTKLIAQTLGMHEGVVLRYMINMPKPQQQANVIQFGNFLSALTLPMRMKLGALIVDMKDTGLTSREISRITGINQRQQLRAMNRPFTHDWSLSQIDRTVSYFKDVSLKDLI